jgi:hypothetical protein
MLILLRPRRLVSEGERLGWWGQYGGVSNEVVSEVDHIPRNMIAPPHRGTIPCTGPHNQRLQLIETPARLDVSIVVTASGSALRWSRNSRMPAPAPRPDTLWAVKHPRTSSLARLRRGSSCTTPCRHPRIRSRRAPEGPARTRIDIRRQTRFLEIRESRRPRAAPGVSDDGTIWLRLTVSRPRRLSRGGRIKFAVLVVHRNEGLPGSSSITGKCRNTGMPDRGK